MSENGTYHYTESGLDWVYLVNGFKCQDTDYGRAVSFHDIDGLHAAIAREIVTSPAPIRGQELRYLRSYWDLSQDGLGKIVGVSRVQIARYEAGRNVPVTPTTDRNVRMFFILENLDPDLAARVKEVLKEIDETEHEPSSFKETNSGWLKAA